MATSNSGKPLDDKLNNQIDFVWGNMPRQPNDIRAAVSDTTTSAVGTDPVTTTSKRIVPGLDGHDAILGGWAGYPLFSAGTKDVNNQYQGDPGAFIPGFSGTTTTATMSGTAGNYSVTYASGTMPVVGQALALASAGYLSAGTEVVSVSGTTVNINLPVLANFSSQTVTIGAAGAWSYTPGILVPNILGQTTANAQDGLRDAGFYQANITSNTAGSNTAKSITAIARTAGLAEVTITATGATAAYPVGTKITIGASTGIPTELVGTWTVTGNASTNQVKFASNGTTVLSIASGALTGSASLTGATGTVLSQTVNAGTLGTANNATITITSW
jgi:hypothetical protein